MAGRSQNRSYSQVLAPLLWVGVIFAFSLTPDPGGVAGPFAALLSPFAHAAEFLVLGILLRGPVTHKPLWLFAIIGLTTALTDESLQFLVPGRVPDMNDVLADAFGYTLGLWAGPHTHRLRRYAVWAAAVAFVVSVGRLTLIYV